MKPKYFGTDGIRGKSFTFLNAEIAYKIGMSLKEAFKNEQVVIGHDTRDSSPMLAYMIASGALASGLDVIFAGVTPTPLIAYYSKLKQMTGVMVTASHNPYTDNGIKIMNKGSKSVVSEELVVESYIESKQVPLKTFGNFSLSDDVKLEYLKLIDKLDLKESTLKVAYDSANGANYLLANKLMSKYFPNSKQIGNKPNGKNINKDCGSTHLDKIKAYINEKDMDLGFAYDGDGDRLILIGNDTMVYDGDYILYILAKHLKTLGKLKNNTVVFTKMTNPGILAAIKAAGINYVLTDVGDKNVFSAMVENDYSLGGESSGHVIIRDLLESGDGLLTSLYILKTIIEANLDLEELIKDVKPYPFTMVNIKNINKEILKEQEVKDYLASVKENFNDSDLFLVRPSGTENLIRVTMSCKSKDKLDENMKNVVEYIENRRE